MLAVAIEKNPELGKYLTPNFMADFAGKMAYTLSTFNSENINELMKIYFNNLLDTFKDAGIEENTAREIVRSFTGVKPINAKWYDTIGILKQDPGKINDMLAGASLMYAQSGGAGIATMAGVLAGGISGTTMEGDVLSWLKKYGISAESGASAIS